MWVGGGGDLDAYRSGKGVRCKISLKKGVIICGLQKNVCFVLLCPKLWGHKVIFMKNSLQKWKKGGSLGVVWRKNEVFGCKLGMKKEGLLTGSPPRYGIKCLPPHPGVWQNQMDWKIVLIKEMLEMRHLTSHSLHFCKNLVNMLMDMM